MRDKTLFNKKKKTTLLIIKKRITLYTNKQHITLYIIRKLTKNTLDIVTLLKRMYTAATTTGIKTGEIAIMNWIFETRVGKYNKKKIK